MESLKLSEQERKYFDELFHACDTDGTGKISGPRATELFRTSGLSHEVLLQVSELCGAKRLGHFGRSQFYIALKLISAAQAGLPPRLDSLNSGVEQLPKFIRQNDQEKWKNQPGNAVDQQFPVPNDIQRGPQQAGQLPPPPQTKKAHARTLSGQYRVPSTEGQQQQYQNNVGGEQSYDSACRSPPIPVRQTPPTSPGAKEAAPAPVIKATSPPLNQTNSGSQMSIQTNSSGSGFQNSRQDMDDWFEEDPDDTNALLGSGTKKYWDNLEPPGLDSSSISSETDSVDDIWSINEEQKEYYVKQFRTQQPDVNGVVIGSIAKDFFEKSKLPVHELSKIWNLSDLNRDGALSLDEFCIAMHLVVLRRHSIELPDHLPPSLMPYSAFTDEPFAADLPKGSTLKRPTPPSSPQCNQQWNPGFSAESPSPSAKPVNFEFQPVATDPCSFQDSKILHPVAVRVASEGQNEGFDRGRTFSDPVPHEFAVDQNDSNLTSPVKQRANTESNLDMNHNDSLSSKLNAQLHGRPRPVPKKPTTPASLPGQLPPPALSSQTQSAESSVTPDRPVATVPPQSMEEPPPPPPRPPHGRSMSMDYNRLSSGSGHTLSQPPAVPPRISPKEPQNRKPGESLSFSAIDSEKAGLFADFSKFETIPSQEVLNDVNQSDFQDSVIADKHKRSLSLDYKMMGPMTMSTTAEAGDLASSGEQDLMGEEIVGPSENSSLDMTDSNKQYLSKMAALRQQSKEKKQLQSSIRNQKQQNTMLSRLNNELNQEYQEVMEQRIALEIQLEHLRPFSS